MRKFGLEKLKDIFAKQAIQKEHEFFEILEIKSFFSLVLHYAFKLFVYFKLFHLENPFQLVQILFKFNKFF